MRVTYRKITIIQASSEPTLSNIDQELQWLGNSLGLFGLRDKDKSCYRVFIALIRALKNDEGLTSDELAYQLGLTRGTVVHHLNNLISSGLIVEKNNRYKMREKSISKVIEAMKNDAISAYDSLMHMAKDIDEKLGL